MYLLFKDEHLLLLGLVISLLFSQCGRKGRRKGLRAREKITSHF